MLGGSEDTEQIEQFNYFVREGEFIMLGMPFLPTHMILINVIEMIFHMRPFMR